MRKYNEASVMLMDRLKSSTSTQDKLNAMYEMIRVRQASEAQKAANVEAEEED